jgi:2-oxoglutarate dehydrogenase E1 component
MGAFVFAQPYLEWARAQVGMTNGALRYAGRTASASTATGRMSKHLAQLASLLGDALGQ